ncbi:MAG: hypothetical protein NVS3B12_07800 [Acidimicrobiales bacterium]
MSRNRGGQKKLPKARPPMPPGREAAIRTRPVVKLPPSGAGRVVVSVSIGGTTLFVATAVAATIAPKTLDVPALVVAIVMFIGGTGTFVWAFALAAGRSRTETVTLTGLFGLSGSAPGQVRVRLLGALAVEVAVGLATAAARPYTSLSFGILAPMWGLGMVGLWAARYGAFARRPPDPRRLRRRSPQSGGPGTP